MDYLQLQKINSDLNIKLNEPLAPYTYTKVGGAADALVFPKTLEEALDALQEDHDYLTAGGVFPERVLTIWDKIKRAEARSINEVPHPAEFLKYYDL